MIDTAKRPAEASPELSTEKLKKKKKKKQAVGAELTLRSSSRHGRNSSK